MSIPRKLTETERAARIAHKVLDRPGGDPDDTLAMLARQFLRARERFKPRPMSEAPRDGTRFLAYLYWSPCSNHPGFGEWREIFFKEWRGPFGPMPWHAGDPWDSHSGEPGSDHFGIAVPIAWVPLPDKPAESAFQPPDKCPDCGSEGQCPPGCPSGL
jgi:hypothetical protein